MTIPQRHDPLARRWPRRRLVLARMTAVMALGVATAAPAADAAAVALLQQRAALQARLQASPFGQPLLLDSREQPDSLSGEVHAELPVPVGRLQALFSSGAAMCEMLLLHLNVRGCRARGVVGSEPIVLVVGPKQLDTTALLHRMAYRAKVDVAGTDVARLTLSAGTGPLGTRDYRIAIEAVAIEPARSFVRLSYAYGFGLMGRAAMKTYLATAGRTKIGFSLEASADGERQPVRGARAALERNVMRYHLALLAYAQVEGDPGGERTEARLRRWFELTERHAPQLHELPLEDYLREKRQDFARAVPEGR
jgi:hypothetical protein